ncbi:MAG: hypothetical protein AB7H86_22920, partial [Blastocatellales bacterium]
PPEASWTALLLAMLVWLPVKRATTGSGLSPDQISPAYPGAPKAPRGPRVAIGFRISVPTIGQMPDVWNRCINIINKPWPLGALAFKSLGPLGVLASKSLGHLGVLISPTDWTFARPSSKLMLTS